jgi:1,4-alpha-glucan branching enzyme
MPRVTTSTSSARSHRATHATHATRSTSGHASEAKRPAGRVTAMPASKSSQSGNVDDAALTALAAGVHSDPHTILGAHDDGRGKTAVRALFPEGAHVELVYTAPATLNRVGLPKPAGAAHRVEMKPGAHGIYGASVNGVVGDYHFEVDGKRVDDPYRAPPTISDADLYLFKEGTLENAAHLLGAHPMTVDGKAGFNFVVWAPNARGVSLVGDFNEWDPSLLPMRKLGGAVYELFVPGVDAGQKYMFSIATSTGGRVLKADPAARSNEVRPGTASLTVGESKHHWRDAKWMKARDASDPLSKPVSTYEVHLPSWKRNDDGSMQNYRQLADELVPHLKREGFNAIELVGLAEHPLDDSWGYQVTGYFAPTSRHGSPDDFKYFVDKMHEAGVRVMYDWVPAHYPKDGHGLDTFDGTHLFDHADPRQGEHKDWGTRIFNYGRNEVKSFLVGGLMHMLDEYHLDGVRVDAVASMLYLDYSRKAGEWVPNKDGGNHNLEAIAFLQDVNSRVKARFPGVLKIAEESTAFPGVTKSPDEGGLGFDLKWNMGWMHDTLEFFKTGTEWRGQNLDQLTNTFLWAYSEKFVAALSHDEVVHLKRSLLEKMPGDEWQKLANLRLLFGFMFGYPGQKLLFMGSEIAQHHEWDFKSQLEWQGANAGVAKLLADLNALYVKEPALSDKQFVPEGNETFLVDKERAVVGTVRKGEKTDDDLVFLHNLTEQPRTMRVAFDEAGAYREVLNTDAKEYGGSGLGNAGKIVADATPYAGKPASAVVTLPPLATLVLKRA